MKFGKEFKRQMVPEWIEAYMDYNALKGILRQIRLSRATKTAQTLRTLGSEVEHINQKFGGDIENQVIQVSTFVCERNRPFYKTRLHLPSEEDHMGGEDEVYFFEKLDEELNKVNAFYWNKVDEVVKQAAELKKQMDACIALRIKVQNPGIKRSDDSAAQSSDDTIRGEREKSDPTDDGSDLLDVLNHVKINNRIQGPISVIQGILGDSNDKELSFSKKELRKVEKKLKVAFREFYRKLRFLNNFSFMNLTAFAKIMKKYEKTTSRYAARSYMKIVNKSYLGSCEEVTKLMEDAEHLFVKHFYNANRREGMKPLRPRERRKKHKVTFLSGFFSGCSIALAIAIVLIAQQRKIMEKRQGSFYIDNMVVLYRLCLYIVLHMLMYAGDIYFWKRYKVNYAFILNFKQGSELGCQQVFLLSSVLAFLALASFLANYNMLIGLTMGGNQNYAKLIPLVLLSVFLAITFCPFNIIYRSSRYFLLKCLFQCICAPFYEVTLPHFFLGDQLTSQVQALRSFEFYICYYTQHGFPQGQSKCNDYEAYNAFYLIIAIIPYWIRTLQCVRRLIQERDAVNGYNALKYVLAILSVVIRTIYVLKSGTTWLVMAIISSAMAALYSTYWDIVVDWGLLRRNSKNFLLRDRLLVSHKSVYYVAMVINVILRVTWLQLLVGLDVNGLRKTATKTIIACLEIIRRGIWNFFRLENEHLNNVGKFRAFRSVPLPFNYGNHNDADDEDDDDDDEKDD